MRGLRNNKPLVDKEAYAFAARGFIKPNGDTDVISFDIIPAYNDVKIVTENIHIDKDNGDTDVVTMLIIK